MPDTTVIRDEQNVVLAQLKATSPGLEFFIGANDEKKAYSKDEMIVHVQHLDEVGKEFIHTQMELLRAFRTGEFQAILMAS